MRIPQRVLKHIVYIGATVHHADGTTEDHVLGTGFLVHVMAKEERLRALGHGYYYLVTAGHVAKMAEGKNFWVRADTLQGRAIKAPSNARNKWIHHQDSKIDLALTDFYMPKKADWLPLIDGMILPKDGLLNEGVGIGDEVFMPGLFWPVPGNKVNTPLVRTGNLAMIPNDTVWVKSGKSYIEREAWLIEARSIGGLSGAPVFIRRTPLPLHRDLVPAHMVLYPDEAGRRFIPFYFLGISMAHWATYAADKNKIKFRVLSETSAKSVNVGISLMVPGYRLRELLDLPHLVKQRAENEKRNLKKFVSETAASQD